MPRRLYTKEDIASVIDLWETKNVQEIAEQMGFDTGQVVYIAKVVRDSGYPLPQKRKNGQVLSMVKELLAERGLIS